MEATSNVHSLTCPGTILATLSDATVNAGTVPEHRSEPLILKYRVYQNDWGGVEVDYIHKYGEETYKY